MSELSEGYYEVEEVAAPAGYILDTERHGIYINPYDPAVENDPILVLTNSKKPTLIIEKLDTQTLKPIKNTRFAVYKDTKLIGNYTTDADGLVELTNLEPGTYTVKETRTASGYVLQDAPQSIELEPGKTATLTFFNPTKPGISIKKIDADTGDELYGATFKIEGVNVTYLNELTTDRDGEIILSDLNPGVYSVSEISAPEGYVRNTEVKVFEATEDGNVQLVFKNYRKPSLKITKVDSDNGDTLYGAAFRIAKVGDATRYYDRVTDRNGVIEIEGLDIGIYTVQEISAPEGYQLNDTLYHVELFEGKDSTLTVENTIKPSLTIIKLDSKTNEPLSGAVFEVYRDARLVGTYTTNIIYGMGHAVYSKSDPRADVLKICAKDLAKEKGCDDDYALYEAVERLAPEIISEKRKIYKGVSANVDFYSGLIYKMLKLPYELYTPIFAIARIAGWSAHRIEEIQNNGKIIRPAYINVKEPRKYVNIEDR